MRQFLLVMLSLAFEVGCAHGPKVTVFVSDPGKGGMEFANQATGAKGFVPYSATEKFIALTPQDAETLLNYCGAQTKSKTPQ
jgi:hypothetical protein